MDFLARPLWILGGLGLLMLAVCAMAWAAWAVRIADAGRPLRSSARRQKRSFLARSPWRRRHADDTPGESGSKTLPEIGSPHNCPTARFRAASAKVS